MVSKEKENKKIAAGNSVLIKKFAVFSEYLNRNLSSQLIQVS
jgi:hypothetical protein